MIGRSIQRSDEERGGGAEATKGERTQKIGSEGDPQFHHTYVHTLAHARTHTSIHGLSSEDLFLVARTSAHPLTAGRRVLL